MNLLYTLTAYPPSIGGAQLLQHHIGIRLIDHHKIQVVSFWDENRSDWLLGTSVRALQAPHNYEIDGIPVHRIGLDWKTKVRMGVVLPIYYPFMGVVLPIIASLLAKYLEPYAGSSDLIHNVRIGREPLSYASYEVAKQHNIPFVLTPVHHPRWKGRRYQAFISLYKRADALLALTNAESDVLVRLGVDPENIHIIGMGPVLASRAYPEEFIENFNLHEPIVLFLGQHYAYKGFRQLLESAKYVWQKVPETNFVFIGPPVGNSEEIFQSFKDHRIHRLGNVDLQIKTDALAACTLLCVPSTQESFGGVFTEAWTFRKPVIGCAIPAVRDVITDGTDGYLVNQDPKDIAELICSLILDQEQALVMGEAGKKKVQSQYSWEMIADRTEQAYLKVL